MIARLTAQRIHIDDAVQQVADVRGPVLEIGLGKGRTYDHLRRRLRDRDVFVFDGSVHAPAEATPPKRYLILGDFRETLPAAVDALEPAALIHADIGSADREADSALAADLAPTLARLLAPDGLLIGDRRIPAAALEPLPAPDTPWPYYRYRRR